MTPSNTDQVLDHFPDDANELLDLSDVLVQIGKSQFPVHSHILSTHSSFFRNMIYDLKHPIVSQTTGSYGTVNYQIPDETKKRQAGHKFKFNIPDISANDFGLLLKYLYSTDYTLFDNIKDAKVLVDLAQRFDIPSIIRNSVPFVVTQATHFTINPHGEEHFDAKYWLAVAEAWNLKPLRVACMAAMADEIAFYSGKHGNYWDSLNIDKVKDVTTKVMFYIARAVAAACNEGISSWQVEERIAEYKKILEAIVEQHEACTSSPNICRTPATPAINGLEITSGTASTLENSLVRSPTQ